ncbi:MAG: aminotransferase class V-fold PLP-dependent enzyme [Candidatus Aenigmatarchaeota archaeon]
MEKERRWKFDTAQIHGGYAKEKALKYNSAVVPIHQTAVYPYESADYAAKLYRHQVKGNTYGRIDNPTCEVLEERMAILEDGAASLGTATGMASIFLLMHQLTEAGDEIVCSNRVYGGTFELLRVTFAKMGVKVKWATNPEDISSWESQITDKTRLLFVETPSNPALFIADVPALAKLAHEHGLPLGVDSTICTPALMTPLKLGADFVVHSCTKDISGNASAIGGVLVAGKKVLIGGRDVDGTDFINTVRRIPYRNMGPSLSPFNAWLCVMGLETLSLRMARHCENAVKVAKFLEKHPKVETVRYPGIPSHPQYKLAMSQMKGVGGLMSFDIKGDIEGAKRFVNALDIFTHTTHLGSTKSIVIQPAATTHEQLGPEERRKAGIGDTMIRMSIGIEDADDLISDIDQALRKV